MSTNNLIRWSAVALIISGILVIIVWALRTFGELPRGEPLMAVGFFSSILLVFGVMGLFGCQIQDSGLAGFLGFVLAIFSNSFTLGQYWLMMSGLWLTPLGVIGPLIGITGLIGYILLAIGTWRAGRLPRWSAVVWAGGYTLSVIGSSIAISGESIFIHLAKIGLLIWATGLIWAGIGMFSVNVAPTTMPKLEA